MREQINVLQYGRGAAALAVVLHHSVLSTIAFSSKPSHLVNILLSHGYLGVDFFFVLSGFIITHAHKDDADGLTAGQRYMIKRLTRIYIPYLPVSALLIVLYLALPSVSQGNRDWGLITSLSLFPTEHPPALSVAWTLTHEMTFYSLFLVSYFTRWSTFLTCAWIASIVVAWMAEWVPSFAWMRVLLAPINLEFIAGIAAALIVRRVSPSYWPAFLFSGLLGVGTFFMWTRVAGVDVETARVWFGLSLAPSVIGLVLIERLGFIPFIRYGLILGNASYAIYIVHNPLISISTRMVMHFNQWQVTLIFCAVTGTIGGVVYHYAVERPALAGFRSILGGGPRRANKITPRPIEIEKN